MSAPITTADVEAAIEMYVDELARHEIVITVEYQRGSRVNGRAHRLFVADTGHGAPGTDDRGYIGWSKSEAYSTIRTMTRALQDVRYLKMNRL